MEKMLKFIKPYNELCIHCIAYRSCQLVAPSQCTYAQVHQQLIDLVEHNIPAKSIARS